MHQISQFPPQKNEDERWTFAYKAARTQPDFTLYLLWLHSNISDD